MSARDDGPTRDELLRENADLRSQLDDFLFHLPDALVESDLVAERVTYLNRMAQMLFGYSAEEVAKGIPGFVLFADDEVPRARAILASYVGRSLAGGAPYERTGRQDLYELRMRRKDGTSFVAETQSSFVIDEQGVPRRMRSIIRDVTARKEMEARLEEMSHRDPLTGCYNRRHLERQRDELERPTARWACLVFDLDNFKAINDTYGHEEGDRVLQGFAHFLSRHHRPDDLLVRTGGDEFALVVRADSEGEAEGVSKRLLDAAALDSPAGFSMGVAYRKPGESLEVVLSRADRTMYAARGRRLRKPRHRPGEKKAGAGS
jgi:diguanylate cyclase (GGDEF)-like protein/PAS domain S-box-containing protein